MNLGSQRMSREVVSWLAIVKGEDEVGAEVWGGWEGLDVLGLGWWVLRVGRGVVEESVVKVGGRRESGLLGGGGGGSEGGSCSVVEGQ